jgi:hypothetical protein
LSWKGDWNHALLAVGEQSCNLGFQGRHNLLDGDYASRLTAALLEFGTAGLEGTRANGETQREANEVSIIELHARGSVAVVEEYFDACGPGFMIQALSNL